MEKKKLNTPIRVVLVALIMFCLSVTGCSKEESASALTGTVLENQDIVLYKEQLAAGSYTLKYEQDGIPLKNYGDICTLELQESGKDVIYKGLITENCAPMQADMIGVYDETENRVSAFELGTLRVDPGEVIYTFGVLSDVHIGYESADQDFQKALKFMANKENVDFILVTGDLTAIGEQEQLKTYRDLLKTFSDYTPVYEITGNHESYNMPIDQELWENYTGEPLYYSFSVGDDIYIMLGMATTTAGKLMDEKELQWLYETLEKYRDKRCFLITHVFPNGSSGNPFELYENAIWVGAEEKVLQSLLAHYPNVTMFHGHSHFGFDAQNYSDTATFDNNLGFNSIHVPATVALRTVSQDSEGDIVKGEDLGDASEGYVVDVCENGIFLRGVDLATSKFLPIAQYYIPTPLSIVEENTYWDATNTVHSTYFVNQIPLSEDAEGKAVNSGKGYQEGVCLYFDGTEGTSDVHKTTGYIPVSVDDVIRISDVLFDASTDESRYNVIAFYGPEKEPQCATTLGFLFSMEEEPGVWSTELAIRHRLSAMQDDVAYFRICSESLNDNSALTVNQPIHKPAPRIENLLPISIQTDGTLYREDFGYRVGYRLSLSTGEEKEKMNHKVTGFMPVTYEDILHIQNLPFSPDLDEANQNMIVFYDADMNVQIGTTIGALFTQQDDDDTWSTRDVLKHILDKVDENTAYFRICAAELTEDTIVWATP